MKRLFFLSMLAFLCMGATTANAQTNKKTAAKQAVMQQADKAAEIKFDTLFYDFGTFSEKSPVVKCSFRFTNTGDAPLVIHQAIASCGCTVPTYTKTPIKPGESGTIDVTYNGKGKFPGRFKKNISVRTNAKNSELVKLTIEGNMEE